MQPLLTFDAVDISYGETKITENVSFTLQPGEILGIVGESGCGKTTLLKAALGMLDDGGIVTRGDIYFEDKDIPDLKEESLRQIRGAEIGMIYQDCAASLCPIRTIGEQIYESLSAHQSIALEDAKAQALALFAKLSLTDGERIWNSYPFSLSGGMNQRVGIALAMLNKPKVLLADEPTSALDVVVQRQVIEELLTMRKEYRTAIILVTHDIGVVRALADKVLVLQNGHVMEYGSTKQVLEHPENAYTKALLRAIPKLKK